MSRSRIAVLCLGLLVLAFLSFLNGYGFASSLIQDKQVTPHKVRQAFGMLLLINGALAATGVALEWLDASAARTHEPALTRNNFV